MADERTDATASRSSWLQLLLSRNGLRLVVGVLLLLLLILFVVENARTVRIRFIFFETNTRLAWALLLAAVVGWIVGLLVPRLRRFF